MLTELEELTELCWMSVGNSQDTQVVSPGQPGRDQPRKERLLGAIGIVLGILALAVAFLSPWIAEQIDPPARPVEEVAVELAARLAEAAKAKVKGEQYIAPAAEPRPSRYIFPAVVAAGMFAAFLGVMGGLRSEDRFISGGVVALGVGAAVVQWSIVIAGALFVVLLIAAIIVAFEGGA